MSPGLSTADVESIRDTLAAGRRPRVQFTEAAGQVAGQVGQVVQLTDPADGDDYLVVRFGRDELPFSPADLAIPARGAARKAAARPAAPPPPPAPPVSGPAARPAPSPREETSTMPATKTATEPAAAEPQAAPPATMETEPAGREGAPARKAAKAARPKPPPGLTVTVAYTEGEWTVAAQQGTKALAKPYVIRPAEALKMVALLDVPGVQEAVEAIVASERAEAQQQAQRLRAELAEIEAKLAELTDGA
jgi:hypothetical protein